MPRKSQPDTKSPFQQPQIIRAAESGRYKFRNTHNGLVLQWREVRCNRRTDRRFAGVAGQVSQRVELPLRAVAGQWSRLGSENTIHVEDPPGQDTLSQPCDHRPSSFPRVVAFDEVHGRPAHVRHRSLLLGKYFASHRMTTVSYVALVQLAHA